jgi:hypothetical protein
MVAPLTLALLVFRVFTDHHDFTLALDYFALFANFLYRRSDFHDMNPPFIVE